MVSASAELLAAAVEHYTFVSSVSVYDGNGGAGTDPGSPVGTIEDETIEEITETSYGPLKALCEQAAERALPGRTLVVRPGADRGPARSHRSLHLLAGARRRWRPGAGPGQPSAPTQVIDVRDLAGWLLDMAERRATGVYNAVGPAQPLTIGRAARAAAAPSPAPDAELVWADNGWLIEHGVEIWTDLPLWLGGDPELEWMDHVDPRPAIDAGLRLRPLRRDDRRHARVASGRTATRPAGPDSA